MALIKCIECEKEISSLAKSCPNCGAPVNSKNEKLETIHSEPLKGCSKECFFFVSDSLNLRIYTS